jgi:hypothetical protein
MAPDPATPEALVRRARAGDQQALAELFASHRERLRQMVRLRLDRRSTAAAPAGASAGPGAHPTGSLTG